MLKKYVFTILFVVILFGCTQNQKKKIKDFQAETIGIKRVITLYADNGQIIRRWEGRFNIERKGSSLYFIDDDGKSVIINGTYIVEEK
ncbi:conserved hypothetical protein [Deferribacter desulfuricans SSM1]|uniref:Lipoprotein n=1 Tax=Deferribacter desulfuricans (strain DSM 14783 / JCM 11476 / NBRC 101012 / SSM1) TaxID=639282 RepID=D3PDY2_DEFDS|nr:hypothetical protein [Deferribacter desulfuricans]BAI80805.1 conserved hypothetical protein [Deferribacter desulfuricans SSM1]